MNRWAAFFRWLGSPFRAIASWFPFGFAGRQTLIYLIFAGAGPALTLLVIWAMQQALAAKLTDVFKSLAQEVSLAHLIVVIGLAMFVAIRSLKIGPDGLEAQGDAQAAATQTDAGEGNGNAGG
jgi:hypothetical protein